MFHDGYSAYMYFYVRLFLGFGYIYLQYFFWQHHFVLHDDVKFCMSSYVRLFLGLEYIYLF